MQNLISWKIGGEQGQGIDSSGDLFATVCNRLGYYVYGYKEFSSRIKGGHSNYKIRVGVEPVASTSDDLHILVAIDQETIDRNHHELVPGGFVVADTAIGAKLPEGRGARLLEVPMTEIANEVGNPRVKNVVSLGVTAYLLGLPVEAFADLLSRTYGRHGKEVVAQNEAALQRGYAYALEHVLETPWKLAPSDGKPKLLMIGNEAVGLGALVAGCRVMSAYPITPASEIMEWLQREFPKVGGVVVQCEDEIAAITMAIGAGSAGARAMTATAGPGLSLMQEAIGLAHAAEIPVVIVDCQRGGPSTGMPTKHEQSDVLAALYGTHGDSPRIALAPSSAEEAFYDTVLAFNLADRYQCPVFVMMDLSLSLNKQTVPELDLSKVTIDRGLIADQEMLESSKGEGFRRYKVTESGISPRSLPGQPHGQFLATGVEHNEFGKVSEDPKNRTAMMDKRLRKVSQLKLDGLRYQGPEAPEALDVLLVGFGSTAGPIDVARRTLEESGIKCGHAHVRVLAPFPSEELTALMKRAKLTLVVENNATGQLAKLIKLFVGDVIRAELAAAPGKAVSDPLVRMESLLKYDGRPFLPREIVSKVQEVISHAKAG